MKFLLHFVILAVCNILDKANAGEHSYLSNFRAIYHGHGATSYQNVQIDNHHSVPVREKYEIHQAESSELGDDHYEDHIFYAIPILDKKIYDPQSDEVSYQEVVLNDETSNAHGDPGYYSSYGTTRNQKIEYY